MMVELDTVVLTRNVPEHGLAAGDVGAIVHRDLAQLLANWERARQGKPLERIEPLE
jgi:hypothetical protein